MDSSRRKAYALQLVIEKHKVRLVEQTGAFGVCNSAWLEEDLSEAARQVGCPCICLVQGWRVASSCR